MVEQKKTSAALNTADRGATLELLSTTTKVEEVNTPPSNLQTALFA